MTYLPTLKLMGRSTANKESFKDGLRPTKILTVQHVKTHTLEIEGGSFKQGNPTTPESYEPRREKTSLQGFRPCPTQTASATTEDG